MIIEQIFDKGLANLSYAIISEKQMAVIDPARNSKVYYDLAEKYDAKIVAVLETHPHADFVSSHLEMMNNGAVIYASKLFGAQFPYKSFDEGDELKIGKVWLKPINTPGHSSDSISIILLDENNKIHSVFTGDALFVGDVGRPDLREPSGNMTDKKEMLAKQLYHSLRNKIMLLPDHTFVYPAHGPGSLCGKAIGTELYSTISKEKKENYALQKMNEGSFVKLLLDHQSFVPKYFPYNVELNRKGVSSVKDGIKAIRILSSDNEIPENSLIVDTRANTLYKSGHLKGAINLQNGTKFETWLGSIISPEEKFYLISDSIKNLEDVIIKTMKIGYDENMWGALAQETFNEVKDVSFDLEKFTKNQNNYTIVDIRNQNEVNQRKIFNQTIHIPLPELRERINEIPTGKPIVVHCAGGYRSAAGSSIIKSLIKEEVFDLGENVNNFNFTEF